MRDQSEIRPARGPASVLAAGGALVAVLATGAGPAAAEPAAHHELPFSCGQVWTGTTRASHSPSPRAVDFNRVPDEGQPALASAVGTVSRVENLGTRSYGTFVVVDHGGGETSWYAHLQAAYVVVGAPVDQGMLLGLVGGTGAVTGPHLHYEQRTGTAVQRAWFHGAAYTMPATTASANCPDVPVAGDWDRDGKAEVGVYRRGATASFRLRRDNGTTRVVVFGLPSDLPLVGDWDGDGADDLGVRRQLTRRFWLRGADGGATATRVGRAGVRGVAGDWDGDGTWEVGLWRSDSASFWLRNADGTAAVVRLGTAASLPVTGDWNGDRRTDVGEFTPATGTWTLRSRTRRGVVSTVTVRFGTAAGLPVTGDWDGDGKTDLGMWNTRTARFTLRTADPVTAPASTTRFVYGMPRG